MSLMSKLQKSSKIGATSVLSESSLFGEKEFINTGVPMINVALSGDLDPVRRAGFRPSGGGRSVGPEDKPRVSAGARHLRAPHHEPRRGLSASPFVARSSPCCRCGNR